MISNIEFGEVHSKFLLKLNDDTKSIINDKEMLIRADKSANICKMTKDAYNKYLLENITKNYKKSNKNEVNKINCDAKKIVNLENKSPSQKDPKNGFIKKH